MRLERKAVKLSGRAIVIRRITKPQEIADTILFFVSSRSNYITGQTLTSEELTFAGQRCATKRAGACALHTAIIKTGGHP